MTVPRGCLSSTITSSEVKPIQLLGDSCPRIGFRTALAAAVLRAVAKAEAAYDVLWASRTTLGGRPKGSDGTWNRHPHIDDARQVTPHSKRPAHLAMDRATFRDTLRPLRRDRSQSLPESTLAYGRPGPSQARHWYQSLSIASLNFSSVEEQRAPRRRSAAKRIGSGARGVSDQGDT